MAEKRVTEFPRKYYTHTSSCPTDNKSDGVTLILKWKFENFSGLEKGIGRGIALKLAELGAEVIAVSRTQEDLDFLEKESPRIKSVLLDISNWDECQRTLEGVGPVDLLVNNAALFFTKEFGTFTEDDVSKLMSVNVKAIINLTQVLSKGMKESGRGGSIVNISSVMGIHGAPKYSAYCATKGAVDQLTRSLASELGPYKIRVNSVNPTVVRTRMAIEAGVFEPGNVLGTRLLDRTPLQRFAEVDEVVSPVLFLLSDYASMITGVILPIDGGLGINLI